MTLRPLVRALTVPILGLAETPVESAPCACCGDQVRVGLARTGEPLLCEECDAVECDGEGEPCRVNIPAGPDPGRERF